MSLVESIATLLSGNATVRTVYGDPVRADGRTIIPVARVTYGFGGGDGAGERGDQQGGGGGLIARPFGVVEVTERGTRFIRASNRAALGVGVLAGAVAGFAIATALTARGHRSAHRQPGRS